MKHETRLLVIERLNDALALLECNETHQRISGARCVYQLCEDFPMSGRSVAQALGGYCDDADSDVLYFVILALGVLQRAGHEGLAAIRSHLNHRSIAVREAACTACMRICVSNEERDVVATDLLRVALRWREKRRVRQAAIRSALAVKAPDAQRDEIMSRVMSSVAHTRLIVDALQILATEGKRDLPAQVERSVLEVLYDRRRGVRELAVRVLARHSPGTAEGASELLRIAIGKHDSFGTRCEAAIAYLQRCAVINHEVAVLLAPVIVTAIRRQDYDCAALVAAIGMHKEVSVAVLRIVDSEGGHDCQGPEFEPIIENAMGGAYADDLARRVLSENIRCSREAIHQIRVRRRFNDAVGRALEVVCKKTGSPNRNWAAVTLAFFSGKVSRVRALFFDMLEEDETVRYGGAAALALSGQIDPVILSVICRGLASEDLEPFLLSALASSELQITTDIVRPLMKKLCSESDTVNDASYDALAAIVRRGGGDVIAQEVNYHNMRQCYGIASVLAECGWKGESCRHFLLHLASVRSATRGLTFSDDVYESLATGIAIKALAKYGDYADNEIENVLMDELNAEDPNDRRAAIDGLLRISDDGPRLSQVLRTACMREYDTETYYVLCDKERLLSMCECNGPANRPVQ